MTTEPRKLPYYEAISQTLAAVSDRLLNEHPEMDAVICIPVYRVPNTALSPAVLRFNSTESAQSSGTNLRAAMQLTDALLLQATRVRQILQAYDTAAAQMSANLAAQQKLLQESQQNGSPIESGTDGRGSRVETTPGAEHASDG